LLNWEIVIALVMSGSFPLYLGNQPTCFKGIYAVHAIVNVYGTWIVFLFIFNDLKIPL